MLWPGRGCPSSSRHLLPSPLTRTHCVGCLAGNDAAPPMQPTCAAVHCAWGSSSRRTHTHAASHSMPPSRRTTSSWPSCTSTRQTQTAPASLPVLVLPPAGAAPAPRAAALQLQPVVVLWGCQTRGRQQRQLPARGGRCGGRRWRWWAVGGRRHRPSPQRAGTEHARMHELLVSSAGLRPCSCCAVCLPA